MSVHIGATEVANAYVGNQLAAGIYVGDGKVWPTAPPAAPIVLRDWATSGLPQHYTGDLLFAIGLRQDTPTALTPGWTLIVNHSGYGNLHWTLAYKVAAVDWGESFPYASVEASTIFSLQNGKAPGAMDRIAVTYPQEVQGRVPSIRLKDPTGGSFVLAMCSIADNFGAAWEGRGTVGGAHTFTLRNTQCVDTPEVMQSYQRFGYHSLAIEIANR